jgi:hypothetical protein
MQDLVFFFGFPEGGGIRISAVFDYALGLPPAGHHQVSGQILGSSKREGQMKGGQMIFRWEDLPDCQCMCW